MRADRLISIIMILQTKKHITATQLASKLEVSVRTIYRDIDNLSHIGIPIVCDRGQGGGIKLLGDYQTTLTGLTTDELNYLFMPPLSRLVNDLGMEKPNTQPIKSSWGLYQMSRDLLFKILKTTYISIWSLGNHA